MFLLLLLLSIVIPFLKSSEFIPYKDHLGKIQFGKCNKKGVLRRFHPTSLLDCAKECLATSECSAINYRRSWFLCDILDERYESHLDWEKGCIYSVISTWNKVIQYMLENTKGEIANGQSRETGNVDKTQDEDKQNKNTTQRGNQEWTIQRNWHRRAHKTQDEDKQNKNTTQYELDTTMRNQIQIT